jgi:hypothetical protein
VIEVIAMIFDLLKQYVLTYLAGVWNSPGSALIFHLYVNARDPQESDTLANYTEASFPGYSPIAATNWVGPTPAGDGVHWVIQADPIRWQQTAPSAPQVVYGYYTTGGNISIDYAEQLWPAGITLQYACDTVGLTPIFEDRPDVPHT